MAKKSTTTKPSVPQTIANPAAGYDVTDLEGQLNELSDFAYVVSTWIENAFAPQCGATLLHGGYRVSEKDATAAVCLVYEMERKICRIRDDLSFRGAAGKPGSR